ncbi:hypothetical protein PESP_a0051 [Pseudoalteromonas espejiana DSM 9414]|uniref:Lipoprotein n=1 Tax=Pseudoalteromonas espejiana TaxID=28107 RepID=A0A510Y0W8_9GAMM|nr:hypothetical protein [Pseudoalteromonas espejiana]ASM48344.1 hypothetical protein PESP_a0051 [Pseudoalteromonas espejiana DSM 9414]GEK56853.1 hypothetical protein PES01_36980 [Pseudoalteromonas espejiana]
MRTPLLALLLPLCLTACLETASNNEKQTTENQLKEVPQATALPENKKAHTKDTVQSLTKTDSKSVSVEDIKSVKAELNSLVANNQCDTNEQCKVTPVGSRACGGPSSFVVYSTKTANDADVLTLSKKITALESNYNAQNEMMSICQHLTTPSTQCVENKCVKLEGSAVSVF